MGFRTWWLESKLGRTERKLKTLRTRQRLLRDQENELAKEKRQGLAPGEAETRERKLHAEKDRVTQEVSRLIMQEEQLKRELRDEGAPLVTH